jgi:hypothetical protein
MKHRELQTAGLQVYNRTIWLPDFGVPAGGGFMFKHQHPSSTTVAAGSGWPSGAVMMNLGTVYELVAGVISAAFL